MAAHGERNAKSKLTWARLSVLKEQYLKYRNGKLNRSGHGKYSAYSTAALAAREGISQDAMWSALSGRTWKGRKHGRTK